MYCMTGRSQEGTGGDDVVTGSEPATEPSGGLRAVLRRLWGPVPAGSMADATAAGLGESAAQAAAAAAQAAGAAQVAAEAAQAAGVGQAAGAEEARLDASQRTNPRVPPLLQTMAAWSWRLLLTGLVIYLAFRFAVFLRLVTLPFIAAMLATALFQPLAAWLRRHGFSPLLSTWCTFLLGLVLVAGALTLLTTQISSEYPVLFAELRKTVTHLQHSLAGPPFHLKSARLSKLTSDVLNYISQHKSVVAGTVLTGGKYATEFLAGGVLTLFIGFFLLKDGAAIWKWLIHGMAPEAKRRMAHAGDQGWRALVNYMRGTTVVACIHAVLLGLALWILGVPLLVPLIILVFIAAFIPLIGILVVGALAILVALATKGVVAAIILLAVLLVENQIEGHLLQPLVVGRIVKLHPLAIILVLAVGGIIAGIPGAIIAVPTAALITYAWPALRNGPPDN
jgi:predicted PurR-regulated permease PerM